MLIFQTVPDTEVLMNSPEKEDVEEEQGNDTLTAMNAYSELFYSDCSDCNKIEIQLNNLTIQLEGKEEEIRDRDTIIAGLQQEKRESSYLINKLHEENKQFDERMFKKDEKLKFLQDRVNQLQDKNSYREKVVELEAEKEKTELDMRRLKEHIESIKEKQNSEQGKLEEKN